MFKLKFKHKILMALFYLVLITSLWPNNIYLLVLFSLLTYIILPINKYWNRTAKILLSFSLFYSMMVLFTNQFGSLFLLISYLLAPVGFFRFGRWLMSYFYEENIRHKLLLSIITCYLLSLFVMTSIDVALVGIVNVSRVMLGDLNDGDGLAATLYGLMASIGIGCISALFTKGQSLWFRLAYIILALLSIFVTIHLVNRTGFVILLGCIIGVFFISTKMNISKMSSALFIIGILILIIVNTGVINEEVLNAYQQREMHSTGNSGELGGRSAIWSDALSKLVVQPFGWVRVRYAHNLWLDIARVGGWIPLLLFFITTIHWSKNCFRLVKNKMTPFSLVVISINIAIFICSFVEPVIEGSMLFFSLFMMFWGITASLVRQ